MPAEHHTVQGDMLDLICRRYYGRHTGTVEMVLAANPNLSELPALLPEGIVIILPDDPEPKTIRTQKLW
ncbi:MAG: tail protein X [Pseudomonadota bacterium]